MKVELTESEVAYLREALDLAIKSSKRAQTGKKPQLAAIHKADEDYMKSLDAKLGTLK